MLIADDHGSVLARVVELLERDYEVVAAVSDGMAAVDAATVLRPDVAILDISMPLLNGYEVAERLASGAAAPRIVFLSVYDDAEFIDAARRAGVDGYVVKGTMTTDLLPALAQVLAGRHAFPVREYGTGRG